MHPKKMTKSKEPIVTLRGGGEFPFKRNVYT
jgi:hypothetical protein